MREINLQEHQRSCKPYPLSVRERDALRQALPVAVTPAQGSDSTYYLRPDSTVGAVEIGDLSVLIEPKIGVPRVLSLACYAIGKVRFQPEDFGYREEHTLPDALAIALTRQARLAFARGLLHGYRDEEDVLYTVRGRIRFDDQLRRRFGTPFPVEVSFDEFTADIIANQLVKAATRRLRLSPLRSRAARRNLGWLASILDEVSPVEFPRGRVPEVQFDRLNEHYRGVVELSRLILRHGAFETGRGEIQASGFLMDMNAVFQEFVTQALREALGTSSLLFREKEIDSLDDEDGVGLRPDLTWWRDSRCVFVGDVKYKNLTGTRVPAGDIYQMLAYATASNLPGGMLIYAQGEAKSGSYRIRHSGKRLVVAALDISGSLDEVLGRVRILAGRINALADAGVAQLVSAGAGV